MYFQCFFDKNSNSKFLALEHQSILLYDKSPPPPPSENAHGLIPRFKNTRKGKISQINNWIRQTNVLFKYQKQIQ